MTKKEKNKLIKLTKYSLNKYSETYRLLFEHEPKVSKEIDKHLIKVID